MKFNYLLVFGLYLLIISCSAPLKTTNTTVGIYDQARQIAIEDFSKTRLFRADTVFYVTLYDTLHRIDSKRIDEHHYKAVIGKAYPDIVAVDIFGGAMKYVIDTTVSLDKQSKAIPTRVTEKNGKLFIWRSNGYPLTDSAIKILTKYHLIIRGNKGDLYKFLDSVTDDAKKSGQYYFCRNNLSIYKRVITNIAIGNYDPPDVSCN